MEGMYKYNYLLIAERAVQLSLMFDRRRRDLQCSTVQSSAVETGDWRERYNAGEDIK